jgi:uncharacterized protein (DUF486 family)
MNMNASILGEEGTDRVSSPRGIPFKISIHQHTGFFMTAMFNSPYLAPILLLVGSNVFMTFAWYGHLRYKTAPLLLVIFASWGIALIEYCMAVPANRFGNAVYSAAELKSMQEVITLMVFAGFSVLYLKEPLGWNHALGFSLIALGAFFIFQKW